MTRRIQVIAPHATRTGSTRVLLDLLQRARAELPVPLAVRLLSSGPLSDDLQALGPDLQPGERPAAVLANTAVTAEVVATIPEHVPVAMYLHESAEVLSSLGTTATAGLRRADLVLCVSDRIGAGAVAHGVDPGAVVVIPPIVPEPVAPSAEEVDRARADAGAAAGARLVLGCGEARWIKGADLFVEVAARLRDVEDLHFAWVGRRTRPFSRLLDHDVDALGLAGRLTWCGEVDRPMPYLAAADVLVAPSRDDAQPLVPLEAAFAGTPTVAFAVLGLADLAAEGAAIAVPYPDSARLADEVRRLIDHSGEGAALVESATARARRLQAPGVVVPRFVAAMASLLDR